MRNCLGCGYCGQGCAYDAKQSTMVIYVADAVARGVKLIHTCDVQRIFTERDRGRDRLVANPMLAIMTLARYQGIRIAHEWSRYA